MEKKIKIYYGVVALALVSALCIFGLYNLEYIKYDDIQKDMEARIGHKIIVQKHIKKDYDYFMFTYTIEDNEKQVGMLFYKRKISGRYQRIGGSWGSGIYNSFYVSHPDAGFQELFAFYGDNSDNGISKIMLDFGDKVFKEDILNDKYYILIYKFADKNRLYPKIAFFNTEGNNITDTVERGEME